MTCGKTTQLKFLLNLSEIFKINVSRRGEHLWKFSLQKNLYAKSYPDDAYMRQSASVAFDRAVTLIRVNPYQRCFQ